MEVRVTAMGNENCGEICWVAAKLMNTTFDAGDYFEEFSRSANARLFGVGFYPRCITLSSIRTSIVDYQKSIIPSPCIRSNQFCFHMKVSLRERLLEDGWSKDRPLALLEYKALG